MQAFFELLALRWHGFLKCCSNHTFQNLGNFTCNSVRVLGIYLIFFETIFDSQKSDILYGITG